MEQSKNILIQTISNALVAYAQSEQLKFYYDEEPLSLSETFYEKGGLILFLYEAKEMYESIYKEKFVQSIIEYSEESSFPIGMIKSEGDCIFDYFPTIHSPKNFDNVLIYTIHALILLTKEYDSKKLPLDHLHVKFHKLIRSG